MSRIDDLRELQGEIDRYRSVSEKLIDAVRRLMTVDLELVGRTTTTALAAAGLIENSYTAIETVLMRISQNFGNNLRPDRWHADLIRRMTTAVPDLRPQVLSDATASNLDELMRFRHFKRYYYNLEFDWKRLQYLIDLVQRLTPIVCNEFDVFSRFLSVLIRELEAPDDNTRPVPTGQ
jgi:hypothetical protein